MRDKSGKLGNVILPFLFSTTLSSWAMSIFFPNNNIESILLVIIIGAVFFKGIGYARRNGVMGRLLFCLGAALYFALTLIVLSSSNTVYLSWLLNWRRSGGYFVFEFWIGTAMLVSFFFSFTVYYFSVIRFRIFFLFLIGIVAFILQLSAKDMLSAYFIIYCILFLALYTDQARRKISMGAYIFDVNIRWYAAAMIIFLSLTMVLSFIIPKPKTIPQITYLDAVVQPLGAVVQAVAQGQNNSGNSTGAEGGAFSVSGFKKESYINSMSPPVSNRILFEVEAKEPLYFRLQSWDKYEKNRWVTGDKELERAKPIESFARGQDKLSKLAATLQKSTGLSTFQSILKYPSIPQTSMKAGITKKFPGAFPILNVPGITGFETDEDREVYMSTSGKCILSNNQIDFSGSYSISYISQRLNPESRENQLFRNLTLKKAEDILNSDIDINAISYEEMVELNDTRSELKEAYKYYTNLPENMPKRIYDLAKSIAKNKTSDYDKALAIEQFFHTSGFSYELKQPKLPAGRDYNDFFVFESKKGICIHFASAMVVLARAAGLPARYVEGFAADEKDSRTGKYLIRQKDAHAFPEVYIAGYGWMVFEPTVSMQESPSTIGYFVNCFTDGIKYIAASLPKFYMDMPVWMKIIMLFIAILLILVMIPVFIHIRRRSWKKRILKIDRSKAIEEVLSKISALMVKIDLDKKKYETPSSYAIRISEGSGVVLSSLIEVFNKAKYGGTEPSRDDIINAVNIYSEAVVLVKRRVGRPKSWLV